MAGKEDDVRRGKLPTLSYAAEEVSCYTKSIASMEKLIADLKKRGGARDVEMADAIEKQLVKDRADLTHYKQQLANEKP